MYLQIFDYVNFHYRNVKAQVKPFLSPSKHSVAPAVVAEWLEIFLGWNVHPKQKQEGRS